MARRGRKRRLGVEDEYRQLVLGGMGTVEACHQARHRPQDRVPPAGRARREPPQRVVEGARDGRYLSQLERQWISTLRHAVLAVRQIAGRLGRAPSTVSRELRRNPVRP
jgi:IS30 family transposase